MRLISAKIKNFKSLEDVVLNFRDLTIIVGANATGKSNCLKALEFLNELVRNGAPPNITKIQNDYLRNSSHNNNLDLEINLQKDNIPINYRVTLSANNENCSFIQENLKINEIKVIDIKDNHGKVWDEDGQNEQNYKSKIGNLALKSAGDFGNKPITSQLYNFIDKWKFYNFDPSVMKIILSSELVSYQHPIINLDSAGMTIYAILLNWSLSKKQEFQEINQELVECLGISFNLVKENEQNINLQEIKVKEIDGTEVNLSDLSDGTLRIIAYHILLYQDDLPPLIGIEEPERNLHPAILTTVASILKRLSQRTQVIITTHSSQLLDCFNSDEINSDISVLLLSKKDASGTQVFRLDQLSKEREDLAEWMQDFGVGSAVYHSNLLQELLEPQYA